MGYGSIVEQYDQQRQKEREAGRITDKHRTHHGERVDFRESETHVPLRFGWTGCNGAGGMVYDEIYGMRRDRSKWGVNVVYRTDAVTLGSWQTVRIMYFIANWNKKLATTQTL